MIMIPVDDSSLVIISRRRNEEGLRRGRETEADEAEEEKKESARDKRRVRVLDLEAIGRRHYSHRLRLPHGSTDLFFSSRHFAPFPLPAYYINIFVGYSIDPCRIFLSAVRGMIQFNRRKRANLKKGIGFQKGIRITCLCIS